MVFSSITFLYVFLPLFLAVYYLLKEKYRNIFLFLASLVFYWWGEPSFLLIMIASILLNYVFGLVCAKAEKININAKRAALFIAVAGNLALLFYFKYFDFLIETINRLFNSTISLKQIALPIGISFFTFQGMSYVIDVAQGKVSVQKNPLIVGLYISMFPQLIAGPIVRYSDIENEITHRSVTTEDFYIGMSRFITGLAKKVLIANSLAGTVDRIFMIDPYNIGAINAWVGAIFYMFQIYFDFSGYSDMAIGLGRMMGFHFLENFNLPYIAKSITEFWRRWHISLSTWFRDYVYIPLGGNRRGNVYLHLIIVFVLTGLWHGAAWNFVIWGLWHGCFLLIERFVKGRINDKPKSRIVNILLHCYTLGTVLVGWVMFRAPSLGYAIRYLKAMLGFYSGNTTLFDPSYFLNAFTISVLICAIIFSTGIPKRIEEYIISHTKNDKVYNGIIKPAAVLILFVICGIFVMSSTYNPFIYFRF